MSWWAVQAALLVLPVVGDVVVEHPGVDEHRHRSVRSFRTPTGGRRRFEPWMSTIVDVTTGRVLGVLDGSNNTGVRAQLAARPT